MQTTPRVPSIPVRRAAQLLRRGGLVGFPTEGLWGIGCNALDEAACVRVLQIKRRPPEKGLIVLAADPEPLVALVEPAAAEEVGELLLRDPGTTWVVPAAPWLPVTLTGGRDTIALRLTPHPVAAALARQAGLPLVSTSANRSGAPPARSALQVHRVLGRELDGVVAGRAGGRPTTIRRWPDGERLR